jgi:hypothetical protein
MGANNVHSLKRNKPLPQQYDWRHYYLHVLLMLWKKRYIATTDIPGLTLRLFAETPLVIK